MMQGGNCDLDRANIYLTLRNRGGNNSLIINVLYVLLRVLVIQIIGFVLAKLPHPFHSTKFSSTFFTCVTVVTVVTVKN